MRRPFSDHSPAWLDNPLTPLYAYLAAVGVLTALAGVAPDALEDTAPVWITYGWTITLALSGVLSLFGCVAERNRVEASGLALLLVALGLYGLATASSIGLTPTDLLAIGSLSGCGWLRLRVLRRSRKVVKRVRRHLDAGGSRA